MLIPFSDLFKKYKIAPHGVIHIGASYGQEAGEYASCGVKTVLWVEAITDVFNKLVENMKQFSMMRHYFINDCIGDIDGRPVIFNIASNEGQSSSYLDFGTHAKEHPNVRFTGQQRMYTRRMDTLLTEHLIIPTQFDFLNIDLQGAELLALKSMGSLMNNIKYAYIEVNEAELYKGCPLIGEIDDYLAQFGFERKETKMTSWKWGDAFYIKTAK